MNADRFKVILQNLRKHELKELNLDNCCYKTHSEVQIEEEVSKEKIHLVESLDVTNDELDPQQVFELSKVLKATGLAKLCLQSNFIGSEGVWLVTDAVNHQLRELDISKTDIKYSYEAYGNIKLSSDVLLTDLIQCTGLEKLAQRINYTKLAVLKIGDNNLNDEDVAPLLKALHNNTTLQSLDLGFNNLTNETAKAILKLLETNKTLRLIQLDENKMDKKFIVEINAQLAKNIAAQKEDKQSELKGGLKFTVLPPSTQQQSGNKPEPIIFLGGPKR